MAHTFADNMNSTEYQCAQGCHIFLEELLNHMELRAQNDILRCALCGSRLYFHKRGSSIPAFPSSNPVSSTRSSSSSIISSVDSPNHKLGMMVCEKSPPLQSTFIAPMQSTQVFSPQLLSSSSIGQFSIPHHVYNNSTQDLSLDLDVEAVKSNLGLDVQSRLRVCNEDYIFSQDLFTNDEFLVSNSNSCSKLVDQGDDIRRLSSTSSDLCQSEISSVTGSSAVSGDVCSAITGKSSEKSGRGRRKKDDILAEYGNDWRPVGVDLKGFNIDLLAPGTIYDSKQTYFTNPHLNRRLCKKEEGPCAAAMDAILATAFKFQLTVWPSINAQSSVFSYKNSTRGRIECKAVCGPNQERCRFHINFRRIKTTTTAGISSCFLSHDCQTGIGLECIASTENAGKKRRRNHELKFVIQSNDLLTHYSHSVDLTRNDGMTAKQLIRSVDNNKVGMMLTVPQAKTFCKSFNNDTFPYHTRQFAQLPDLFRRLVDVDPNGLYILSMLPVSYEIPGMDSSERDKQLMFDYCLLIPSAAKTFFSNGNKITVLDGAHMYSKYEGIILTICGKDGEDHVLQLGFALVPQENKFYWQEVFNAVFHYLREHRMIMSDKAKGKILKCVLKI